MKKSLLAAVISIALFPISAIAAYNQPHVQFLLSAK
jgi:hypothetical protein